MIEPYDAGEWTETLWASAKWNGYTMRYKGDLCCLPEGCKGHTATFDYSSPTDTFSVDWGRGGSPWIMEPIQFAMMQEFIKRMTIVDNESSAHA